MKKTLLNRLVVDHINEVRDFYIDNLNIDNVKSPANPYKIGIICPYCEDGRNRKKLTLNLDWGNFKCFRCGETGSLIRLLKHFNLDNEYIELLASFSNLSNFNIKALLRSNTALREMNVKTKDDTDNKVKEFIEKNGLLTINKLKSARTYALERVFNNEAEIESYLADDKYIYIPQLMNDKIVSFIGRLYNENTKAPRYSVHQLERNSIMIGFYDDVVTDFTNNSLYVTEGYFDAFAINYSFSCYNSICLFGKNKMKTNLKLLANSLPSNTKVHIVLDSFKKDKTIIKDSLQIGELMIQYFPYTNICELKDDNDPADMLKNNGPIYVKEKLTKSSIPFMKYKILRG